MSRRLPAAQSPEAIADLVRDMLQGTVVDGFQVMTYKPHVFNQVFIPIGLGGALVGYTKRQLASLAVFAIIGRHKDCGWHVNKRWPMFVECCVWRRTDWRKAVKLYERAKEAQEAVLAGAES